ncbi:MAG TPA: FAD-dependent oxidoreductase [Candidatus Nanoarchaeia archaeon]|nr:FAD-dependent oxidoreductase [Candidatus Nanoarchaeia archaeon]
MGGKKIVIIGGGFAGAYLAKNLQDSFKVTLVDKKEYFEFTPSILKVIVNPKSFNKIQICHKTYLDKGEFICGEVSEVGRDYIIVAHKKLKFDYLVLASGSKYNAPIKDPLVLVPQRGKEIQEYHDKLEKAGDVVIVGGGLVGVELASEIKCVYKDKKITLIQFDSSLIPRNCKKSRDYAQKHLEKCGVKLIFNEMVIKKDKNEWITDKGNKVKGDIVFFCTGIKSNSEFMSKNFKDKLDGSGHIKTNTFLQLEGFGNIFVAGDVSDIKEEKTAQGAEDQAQLILKNIKKIEGGKDMREYQSSKKPFVISLGRNKGIFEYRNFTLTGFIPSLMKKAIEWKTMWRYR